MGSSILVRFIIVNINYELWDKSIGRNNQSLLGKFTYLKGKINLNTFLGLPK